MLDIITLAIFDAKELLALLIDNVNYLYLFVFVFMVIESSFIPFPSELVVPPAIYLALQDNISMNPYLIILLATVGALVGAYINYYLAIWLGRPLVYKFANSRFGHICLLDQSKVEKAEVKTEEVKTVKKTTKKATEEKPAKKTTKKATSKGCFLL